LPVVLFFWEFESFLVLPDPRHTLEYYAHTVMAIASGDGALANGGPKARRNGAGTMNALWKLPSPSAAAAAPLPRPGSDMGR